MTALLILIGLCAFVAAWCWACVIVRHWLDNAREQARKDML